MSDWVFGLLVNPLMNFWALSPYVESSRSEFNALYKSEQRKCEVLAVSLLIKEIIGDNVQHFASG